MIETVGAVRAETILGSIASRAVDVRHLSVEAKELCLAVGEVISGYTEPPDTQKEAKDAPEFKGNYFSLVDSLNAITKNLLAMKAVINSL